MNQVDMLTNRAINLPADRDAVLDLHCLATFERESQWVRPAPFSAYRAEWLNSDLPDLFLEELSESMDDPRTVVEVWQESGRVAGFLWVVFTDLYDVTVAQIYECEVSLEHQRQGIGTLMLRHAEELAVERGARVLHSTVNVTNENSQSVHDGLGYTVQRVTYEKLLGEV